MKITMEVDSYEVGPGENVLIFPSGFEGQKIAVNEDCAYNLSAWYPTKEQIEEIIELDKQMKDGSYQQRIMEKLKNG